MPWPASSRTSAWSPSGSRRVVRRSGRPSLVARPAARQRGRGGRHRRRPDRRSRWSGSAATCSSTGSAAHHRGEHDVEHVVESVAQMVEEVLGAHAGAALPRHRRLGARRRARQRRPGPVRAQPGLGRRALHRAARRSGSASRSSPATTPTSGVLAEHLRGAAVGHADVAYLNGSVGIGGGFLVGRRAADGRQRVRRRGRSPAGRQQRHAAVPLRQRRLLGDEGRREPAARARRPAPRRRPDRRRRGDRGRRSRRRARASRRSTRSAQWIGVGLRAVDQRLQPRGHRARRLDGRTLAGRQDVVDKTLDRWTLMSPRSDVIIRPAAFGAGLAAGGAAEMASRRCWPIPQRPRPGRAALVAAHQALRGGR